MDSPKAGVWDFHRAIQASIPLLEQPYKATPPHLRQILLYHEPASIHVKSGTGENGLLKNFKWIEKQN